MLAFACEPDEGSEPEVGWKWAHTMAQCCDVTVVTQTKNLDRIENWQRSHPGESSRIRYSYLELPPLVQRVKKGAPGGMYGYYALWQWRLRTHVEHMLRQEKFDLIHHVTFASFRMPVFVKGLPVVWGPVGGAELAPMHLLHGDGTLAGRARERIRNISTRIAGRGVRLWAPTLRTGGVAVASTPATAELLKRNNIACSVMPTIGYDRIATEESSVRKYPEKVWPLRLLFAGRLHLLKGLHLALRAMTRQEAVGAHLTIVGDGPERQRLLKMTSEFGLEDRVSFTGYLPRTNLGAMFKEHDVVLAPSLYESGGLSVLEGFAHGLPAIVLDCGGHAISVDSSCGIKVSLNQAKDGVIRDLACAMDKYSAEAGLLEQHARGAVEKVRRCYSWERKRELMWGIYLSVAQLQRY